MDIQLLRLDLLKFVLSLLAEEPVEEDEEIDLDIILANVRKLEEYVING